MLSAIQIRQALEHARFPILNFEQLHLALHQQLHGGEQHCEGCELRSMEELFSPRDFLFTNAEQVQRVVEARACALTDQEDGAH